MIAAATTVANALATGSKALDTQWTTVRSTAATRSTSSTTRRSRSPGLNVQIRSALAAGGSANELQDQRDRLTQQIAGLAGGTVRTTNTDGTVDVLLGGNPLVQGDTVRTVALEGGARLGDGAAVSLAGPRAVPAR